MRGTRRATAIFVCSLLVFGLLAASLVSLGFFSGLAKFVMLDRWEEMIRHGVINRDALEKYQDGRFAGDRFLLADDLSEDMIRTSVGVSDWTITGALLIQAVVLLLVWRQFRENRRATQEVAGPAPNGKTPCS
jgi:membrane protein implicated in regulation of membrane protease activity